MARPLRVEYEGAVYHITSRGNARESIFLDDEDRIIFLAALGETVTRYGWICHAYCLMSNHYHLLLETPSPNLSRGMKLLNGVYTQRFNRHHKRCGHLLQGRYKSILVEKESHLLELARYVVLNPIRAKIVRSIRDWPWSSYRATSGQAEVPEFLKIDWILSQFDASRDRAIRAYRRFVRQGRGVGVWGDLRAGSLLGGADFVEKMRPRLLDTPLDQNVLRRERDAARPSLDEIFLDVVDKSDRDTRIHTAVRVHHYKLQEVADHLGLHFSTISVIANREASRIRE
jgi:putative transposase